VKRPGPLRRFYFKIERKKGGQIAKVATARKLLEWVYHILRDGKTYQETERIADLLASEVSPPKTLAVNNRPLK
jgi:hypothetical protein